MKAVKKHKYIKLTTGEELISKVYVSDWEKNSFLKLEDPMMIMIYPPPLGKGQSGSIQVGLSKWIPYIEDDFIHLPFKNIIIVADVVKSLRTYYNRVVGENSDIFSTVQESGDQR